MSKKIVAVYLTQGEGLQEIRMCLELDKTVADKMGEIRSRDPQRWEKRDLDLLDQAEKELGIYQEIQID